MRKNENKPRPEQNELGRLLEFLYDPSEGTLSDDRKDLEACGINVSRVEAKVAEIVEGAARAARLGWIDRAREKQACFEERLRLKREELARRFSGTKELVAAMMNGELGPVAQAQARVFFRNKNAESVSEQDLVSFIEDCKLLEEDKE